MAKGEMYDVNELEQHETLKLGFLAFGKFKF